jgi:TIR domain-containing protein
MTIGVRFFVSYARADKASQRLVASMKYALGREGHEVFVDTDLPAGVNWYTRLVEEIDKCDAFVLLLSAQAMRSESFVHKELDLVRKRMEAVGKPRLLTVRTQDDVPLGDLADLQCIEWRSKNDTLQVLIELQDAVADLDQRPTTPVIARKPRRRLVWIAAMVAVVALLAIIAGIALMNVLKLRRADTDEEMRDAYASTWFFRNSIAEKYWTKRGAAIEADAAKRLKDQRSRIADQGLVLAALASLKSGNALLADARAYYDAGYDRLITSLRFTDAITGDAFAVLEHNIVAGGNVLRCSREWDCNRTTLDIDDYVRDAAFVDDKTLVTVTDGGRADRWDLRAFGSPIGTTLTRGATSVAAADGEVAIALDRNPSLLLQTEQAVPPPLSLGGLSSVAFGPCRTCVTVLTARGLAAIWNYETNVRTNLGADAKGIAATRAGHAVVVWNDGSVSFHDSDVRAQLYVRQLDSIALSNDGRRAVIAHDGIVEIVDERGKSETLVGANSLPAPDAALWLDNLILTRAPEDIRVWSSAATSVQRDVAPGERWREWRKKLGYTVDASGAVVIGTGGAKQLGWNRAEGRIEEH